jgi:hypothetical protein
MDDLAYIQSLVASHNEPRGSSSEEENSEGESSSDSSDTDSSSSDDDDEPSEQKDTGGSIAPPPVDDMQAVQECLATMVTNVARAAEGLGHLSDSRYARIANQHALARSLAVDRYGCALLGTERRLTRCAAAATTRTTRWRCQSNTVAVACRILPTRRTAEAAPGELSRHAPPLLLPQPHSAPPARSSNRCGR